MKTITILGVMTGTSCDGLDAAAVRFSGGKAQTLWTRSTPYSPTLKARVLALQASGRKESLASLLQLHRDLGDWYGQTLSRMPLNGIDLIANHGQTVAHFAPHSTLQLGEPACISQKTGLTLISDFRWGDLASGGQGAPLVPKFHRFLFESITSGNASTAGDAISLHNLGGISNLTYLNHSKEPRAWDTGPANLWIDAILRSRSQGRIAYDRGGRIAMRGKVAEREMKLLLDHPFFLKKPPKSTGRDDFTEAQVIKITRRLSTEDAVATATAATARSIAESYVAHILRRGQPLSSIYFCGGGAKNKTLTHLIQLELMNLGWWVSIDDTHTLGIDPQFMEASAFAYLGYLALQGEALGGPWTGGSEDAPSAKITPGKNWRQLSRWFESRNPAHSRQGGRNRRAVHHK